MKNKYLKELGDFMEYMSAFFVVLVLALSVLIWILPYTAYKLIKHDR